MRRTIAVVTTLAALGLVISSASALAEQPKDAGATDAIAAAPDAESALAAIKALKPPPFDEARKDDAEYVQQLRQQMHELMQRRAAMAKAFHDRFPDHPESAKLMSMRWQILSNEGQPDVVAEETEAAITQHPDTPIAAAARFARAQTAVRPDRSFDEQMQAVEEFIAAEPEDPRGGDLLVQLASWGTEDVAKQRELLTRVKTAYPDSRAAKSAEGKLRQVDGIGQPFELSFTDAVSGKAIDMKDLRGKVVVVDFWATWCGPCVAEMPKMKSLYSQYKDKGVEFIGISLDAPEDQGGLEKLKTFVAEQDLPWLQYYQGAGWQSEFSSSWGINSIPAIFVVDHEGKLHSTSARGKLDEMIPDLIAKRDGKQATAK